MLKLLVATQSWRFPEYSLFFKLNATILRSFFVSKTYLIALFETFISTKIKMAHYKQKLHLIMFFSFLYFSSSFLIWFCMIPCKISTIMTYLRSRSFVGVFLWTYICVLYISFFHFIFHYPNLIICSEFKTLLQVGRVAPRIAISSPIYLGIKREERSCCGHVVWE